MAKSINAMQEKKLQVQGRIPSKPLDSKDAFAKAALTEIKKMAESFKDSTDLSAAILQYLKKQPQHAQPAAVKFPKVQDVRITGKKKKHRFKIVRGKNGLIQYIDVV